MLCKKCNSYIPEKASKCNNCKQKTGYHLGENPFPKFDMYGNQVFEFETDESKENIRNKYLETLPEYKELDILKKQGGKLIGKVFLLILLTFPCAAILGFIGILLSFLNIALGIIWVVISLLSIISKACFPL